MEAADIPIIRLSAAGPQQQISTESAFYLAGTEETQVDKVRPVFVRVKELLWQTAWPCDAVRKAFDDNAKIEPGKSEARLFSDPAGRGEVQAFWEKPTEPKPAQLFEQIKHMPVLLPALAQFEKPTDTGSEYKVLVDDPSFFRPGSHVCLFLFKQTRGTRSDQDIAKKLLDASSEYAKCARKSVSQAPVAGNADSATGGVMEILLKDLFTNLKSPCMPNLEPVKAHVATVLKNATEDERKRVLRAVDESRLWDIGRKSSSLPKAISGVMGVWKDSLKDKPLVPSVGGQLQLLVGDASLVLMAQLLTQHRQLLAVPAADPAGKRAAGDPEFDFYTRKEGLRVSYIGLTPDLSTIEFASTNKPPPEGVRALLKQPLSALSFPDSKMSYLDVLQFIRGNVRWGGSFTPISEFSTQFEKFPPDPSAITEAQRKDIREFTDWLLAMIDLVRASAQDDAPAELHELNRWLRVSLQCKDLPGVKGLVNAFTCPEQGKYFSFRDMEETPFKRVVDALTDYLDALDAHKTEVEAVAVEIKGNQIRVNPPMSLRVGLTQKSFFTYFVTPVTGFTYVPLTRDSFTDGWFHYVGIQFSRAPNPIDQPMWSNGGREDFARMWALELGLGTTGQPFDASRNFRGPRLFSGHPVHAGIAIRPLPYLSGTVGLTLLEQRSTPLLEERGDLVVAPAFSAAVQVNVPDLIRKLIGAGNLSAVGVFP